MVGCKDLVLHGYLKRGSLRRRGYAECREGIWWSFCVVLGPVCGVMLLATRNEFVVKHSFLSLYLPRTFVVAEG